MLSRVANSIYWMARYVERAENLARFVDVTQNSSLEHSRDGVDQWGPLVRATGDEEYFEKHHGAYSIASVLHFLTFDLDYHSSIQTSINNARENARTVREAISSEAWHQLNAMYHFMKDAKNSGNAPHNAAFYDEIVQQCYKLTGIIESTMTRGRGWHFATIGRHLERADKTSRILDVKYFTLHRSLSDVDSPFDDLLWSDVLRSSCGFEMYRKRYHGLTVERIVDFLILDPIFPRAMRYAVQQVKNSLAEVSGPVDDEQNPAMLQTDALLQMLDGLTAKQVINGGLHEFTDTLQQSLNSIGEAVHQTYFANKSFPHQQQQQQ